MPPKTRSVPMPTPAHLAPQVEQFLHDNPQGVLTSFRRNGMPQLSIVTVYPRDGDVGISITENRIKFKQRSAKKLMQNSADGGYDRRQRHPRVGGDDHVIPL